MLSTASLLVYSLILLGAEVDSTTPSQLRKKELLDAVVQNYGESKPKTPCPCRTNSTSDLWVAAHPSCRTRDYELTETTKSLTERDPTIPVWPYMGLPLPNGTLENVICRIACKLSSTGDMDLSQLVRALYLTNTSTGKDEIIKPLQALYDNGNLPFWLEPGETHRIVWSENHMIMNMANDHLLRPLLDYTTYNYTGLETLHQRLRHWLDLKIQYGFYEFYSTMYLPYTLGALLNLIDFSSDSLVQDKATQVADRLISEWLLATNSAGYIFPVAGRNYEARYRPGSKFFSIQWMTLGTGKQLDNITWAGDYVAAFLATSTYDLEKHVSAWTPLVDRILTFGHDASLFKTLHASFSRVDRTIFQWSAGGYILPETVDDTRFVVKSYLQHHEGWKQFLPLFQLPLKSLRRLSSSIPGQSRGSDISGARVYLYKNHNVVLSSLSNYLVGARSGQQWPWVATVEDVAIYTESGVTGNCVAQDLGQGDGISNTHLPLVNQKQNVALISYRPSYDIVAPSLVLQQLTNGIQFPTQVAMRFPLQSFDAVIEIGKWILGRKLDSYIAMYRHGLSQNNCTPPDANGAKPFGCEPYYYSNPGGTVRGQVWVAVVGNNETHASFEQFQSVIAKAKVKERTFYTPFKAVQWLTYKTSVRVDGKSLVSVLRGYVQRPFQSNEGV